ncbi:MAG: hypothetical protein OXG71_10260 [Rhodospirillales bacterium]|nr:hypothetical protein [Rhodospirillales bacterium]
MRVKLGIKVARGPVPEGHGHHLLAAHPHCPARRLVLRPGSDGVFLDPRQRIADRIVVRVDNTVVTACDRLLWERLRRPGRNVVAGAVMKLPVLAVAPQWGPVRNVALEDLVERVQIDRARKPEQFRALARPMLASL